MKAMPAEDSPDAIVMCRTLSRRTWMFWSAILLVSWGEGVEMHAVSAAQFTRLTAIDRVQIIAHAAAFPGGRYEASNLIDGDPKTEYASAGKGIQTSVDFDFGGHP